MSETSLHAEPRQTARFALWRALVDVASAAIGLWLLWDHRLAAGIVITLAPPIAFAMVLAMRDAASVLSSGSERLPFQAVRLVGLAVAAYAAWEGQPWLLAAGAVLYLASFAPVIRRAG